MSIHDLADLTALRHQLHRRPEIRFNVGGTAALVAQRLDEAGLEVTTGVGGSGVVGTLRRGRTQRGIGLRADLDALPIDERGDVPHASEIPGTHHGCGHDDHTTMLLGAAQALARSEGLDGTVQFIFQPAEETGRGAQAMIDDGLFDRFPMDSVFDAAVHAARNVQAMSVDATAESMGFSEDFAQYLQHRPGCFVVLGNGTDGAHGRPLHHPSYDFNDAALPFGIDFWCELVHGRLGQ